MLVVTRKVGERIVIGDNVTVTVVRIAGGMVRVGVEAPADYSIVRRELLPREGAPADGPARTVRNAENRSTEK